MKARSAATQASSKRTASPRQGSALSDRVGKEIPREEWRDFLDDFSAAHEGWLTDLEVFQADETTRIQARGLALEGVFVDADAPDSGVSIALGEETADHVTHTIPRAVRVRAIGDNELQIESGDQGRAVVRCHREAAE